MDVKFVEISNDKGMSISTIIIMMLMLLLQIWNIGKFPAENFILLRKRDYEDVVKVKSRKRELGCLKDEQGEIMMKNLEHLDFMKDQSSLAI